MKTSTLLKSLSAVGILGTAVFSVNAHADCYCPTGHAIGGNNCGIPKQGGGGWQHIFPMTCTADSPTPSRSSDEGLDYVAMARQIDPKTLQSPTIVYAIDRTTDNVTTVQTTENHKPSVKNQLAQKCPTCEIGDFVFYDFIQRQYQVSCLTLYKAPETTTVREKGFFSKPKTTTATATAYDATTWGKTSLNPKQKAYQTIQAKNGTVLKDICLN